MRFVSLELSERPNKKYVIKFKEPNKTNLENLIKREVRRRKLDNLGI